MRVASEGHGLRAGDKVDLAASAHSGRSQVLQSHTGVITAIATLADSRIVTGSLDASLRVWHTTTRLKSRYSISSRSHVTTFYEVSAAFAWGGGGHLTCCVRLQIELEQELAVGDGYAIDALAVMPSGQELLTSAGSNQLCEWDFTTVGAGKLTQEIALGRIDTNLAIGDRFADV